MKNESLKIGLFGLVGVALLSVTLTLSGCGETAEEAPAAPAAEPAAAAPASEPAGKPAEAATEEPAPAAVAAAGVHGRVAFDGPRPERSVIETDRSDPKCSLLHGGEPILSELRVVSEDGGVQHTFLYVKNAPEGDYPLPGDAAVLDQVGCMYTPHVLGMRAGQPLNVKNSDETTHNIRSFAKVNKPFNISQPTPGVRERQFPKPEMAVKIKCDFHPWMTAYVFAMAHPFYAVTDENGHFSIDGLPDGDYTLVAWHEVWGEQEVNVTVSGGSAEANFTYSE